MAHRSHRSPRTLPLALATLTAIGGRAEARHEQEGSFPPHFESIELPGSLDRPVDLVFLPDGTMLISGKRGEVRFHDGNGVQATPVLDIRDEIVHTGDRGMLGLAVPPGYLPDGGPTSWIYLAYTVTPTPGENPSYNEDDKYSFARLTRYKTITDAGDIVADEGTREVLLGNQLPDGTVPDGIASLWSSHTVGSLLFGSDGSLLISAGDGGHADQMDAGGLDAGGFETFTHPVTGLKGPMSADQDCGAFRSQDLRSLAGKILRVDPETGLGYPSNPFYDGDPASFASRVWALGLRNPYRVSLVPGTGSADPVLGAPGTLLIGDVGWNGWEELDLCTGGENFGWPCFEGPLPSNQYPDHEFQPNPFGFPDCDDLGPGVLTAPLLTWHHSDTSLMQPPGVHVDENGVPQVGLTGNTAIAGVLYPGGDYPPQYAGRFFISDYADDWIRAMELNAQDQVIEVADFAFEVDMLVDLETHPITGEVYYVEHGLSANTGYVHRIRYGANLTPTASLSADPTFGDLPLVVSFDASGSSDPEDDPLTYEWDFGDGSPTASGVSVQHTYVTTGVSIATLTVTDDGGLSDVETVQIAAGDVPPLARILTPLPGTTFAAPETLQLSGTGTDFQGGTLTYEWSVDLYHDTHIHPDLAILPGASVQYDVEPHGAPDELYYLRIQLTARNEGGLEGTDHVFAYPVDNTLDPTGTALLATRVQELVPPFPTGTGNLDPEVMRDADLPPQGNGDRSRQYDTFHDGDQGDDDWVSIELTAPPDEAARFTGLTFQEGIHFTSGGWFDDFRVEVRDGGVWEEVESLRVLPAYPFELAAVPGFDGTSFDTYALHFDPVHGDAVRLRGNPGGSLGYISVGELRARLIAPVGAGAWHDVTDGGEVISKIAELVPPFPLGEGSLDPNTVRNGTWPPAGSDSKYAQLDTFHNGDQGSEDWIGYRFDQWRLMSRVLLQEGYHYPGGGWFEDVDVETRASDSGPWQPVGALTVAPALPGDTSPLGTYETFELLFDPVVAREIRLVGTPGGVDGFVSIGELRVFHPAFDDATCGWQPYGEGAGGANALALGSTTPPLLGHPSALELSGASSGGPGTLLLSAGSLSLPVLGGTLLVDPVGATLIPIAFDAGGASELAGPLPSNPALVGQSFYLQAVKVDAGAPQGVAFSNGLELVLCP